MMKMSIYFPIKNGKKKKTHNNNNSSGIKSAVRCLNSKDLGKVGLAELNVPLIGVLGECPFCSKGIHNNCH